VLLSHPNGEEEDSRKQEIILRGERAALAVTRFREGGADFVTGGTAGSLPVARAARLPAQALRFDPVQGMFGLTFLTDRGILGDVEVRKALSMAIDRDALVAALDVPNLQPRISLLPLGLQERPNPTLPNWVTLPFNERRSRAARTIARLASDTPPTLRVALPDEPGYQILFALIRRQWNAIGIRAEAVGAGEPADLALVDSVAPANLASWYLRHFTCRANRICSADADEALEAARDVLQPASQRENLANADRLLAEETPFIALTAPVRWHLVTRRLSGFQTNAFGRHPIDRLIAERRR
jgi:peptide/nickel transport system substrate-binding protein